MYVASTLSAPTTYVQYLPQVGDRLPQVEASVTIAGGAGIATKHLVTPQGVVTHVTDEEVAVLKANPVFKLHMENGYVQFVDSPYKPDGDNVAANMERREPSAPIVPEDYSAEAETVAKPSRGRKAA